MDGERESAGLAGMKASWPCSLGVDFESSDLEFGGESGFADDAVPSGSPVVSSIIADSPAGSKLPSSDLVVCSGPKARAVVGAANPSKIKSPWISAT